MKISHLGTFKITRNCLRGVQLKKEGAKIKNQKLYKLVTEDLLLNPGTSY